MRRPANAVSRMISRVSSRLGAMFGSTGHELVELQRGQLFVAPLLGGGFAFGCVTRPHDKKFPLHLVAIYDVWAEREGVPTDLEGRAILLNDLLVGGCFDVDLPVPVGSGMRPVSGTRWRVIPDRVAVTVPHVVQRYYRMGGLPRGYTRFDILGDEGVTPVTPDEAARLPVWEHEWPGVTTAIVEVAVKRLAKTPDEIVEAWVQRESKRR